MKLRSMKLRTIGLTGAVSLVGLGLVGIGAHAVFTTGTSSTQSITAGTLGVVISSPSVAGCSTVANGCTSLTLPALGGAGIGSTFDTTPIDVWLTNTGNIPAYYNTVAFNYSANPTGFASDVGLCDFSTGFDGHFLGADSFSAVSANNLNGSVVTAGPTGVIQPGQSDEYTIEFYAGVVTTTCGASALPALPNADQGATLSSTLTYTFTG